MGKTYAVRVGRKVGLFRSWPECQAQVSGFAGAEYKSFPTESEARAWMERAAPGTGAPASDVAIYTDGSYRGGRYGWAFVVLKGGELVAEQAGAGGGDLAAESHNIAGELHAVMQAVSYARREGLLPATIYHDLEGAAKWVNGAWQARNELTQSYVRFMQPYLNELTFVHVRGHSGVQWNERCDVLAKEAMQRT